MADLRVRRPRVRRSGPEPDALYLRMDERPGRVVVVPGDSDRVVDVAWEVRDHAALTRVRRVVEAAGVAVKALSVDEADARRVEEVIAFQDPSGTSVEVFHGPALDHSPGGHAARCPVRHGRTGSRARRTSGHRSGRHVRVLHRGARVPAPRRLPPAGSSRGRSDAHPFLGVNQRHHSLALMPVPAGKDPGLIHIMVEVDTLDAVGRALDRVTREGYSVSSTLGRHTNDKMVSFYVRAPGGWDIEYGTDGTAVDERYYTAEEITADSYWGHDWSGSEPLGVMS
ncbi:iron-dependent extradiol dioxygenase [Rhodococcus ruber]|nr:iron-dependent extradiol dioxygenase [Rhodococcus ruber]